MSGLTVVLSLSSSHSQVLSNFDSSCASFCERLSNVYNFGKIISLRNQLSMQNLKRMSAFKFNRIIVIWVFKFIHPKFINFIFRVVDEKHRNNFFIRDCSSKMLIRIKQLSNDKVRNILRLAFEQNYTVMPLKPSVRFKLNGFNIHFNFSNAKRKFVRTLFAGVK